MHLQQRVLTVLGHSAFGSLLRLPSGLLDGRLDLGVSGSCAGSGGFSHILDFRKELLSFQGGNAARSYGVLVSCLIL